MKLSKRAWLVQLISFSAAGLVFLSISACKKATPKDSSPASSSDAASSPEPKQQRLEWSLTTLVKAYEQAGHSNPNWDEPAKRALIEFARSRAGIPGTQSVVISTNVAAAVQAGCDDPMVNYLFIKYSMSQTNSKEAFTAAFYKTALAMEASSYPPIRKFYAGLRTIEQYSWANNYSTNWSADMVGLFHRTTDYLGAVLNDANTPAPEIYDACHDFLNIWGTSKETYPKIWQSMEPLVFKNWSKDSSIWLLKGEAYIRMAWLARGNGYANTVSDEGWKLFSEYLATAQDALERAWKMNSHDVRIPVEMMSVMLGQGGGRDRMETWFNRGMALNQDNYGMCYQKLYYLEPKWHGSREDMITFGHECVGNTNWGGRVPLILVYAHWNYCQGYVDKSEQTNYWKQADVWPDIKAAYDRFFELNPGETGYYQNYAWYAYHAEQWEALNELIPKFGPSNYYYFGGEDEFNKMVQLAKEHASNPK